MHSRHVRHTHEHHDGCHELLHAVKSTRPNISGLEQHDGEKDYDRCDGRQDYGYVSPQLPRHLLRLELQHLGYEVVLGRYELGDGSEDHQSEDYELAYVFCHDRPGEHGVLR